MIWSQLCDIESSILNFITNISSSIGFTLLFSIGLAIEALFVFFFVLKSLSSYEMRVTKSIEKLNLWLFQNKKLTEDNIKEFNNLVKTKTPKRLNHYWQQFILFREGNPSTYMSADNIVDKPLKASSINSNIRNLTLVSVIWAVLLFILGLAHSNTTASSLSIQSMMLSLILPFLVILLGGIFVIILRARKNVNLNTLYQNLSLFNRFLDNACVELPSYIDYQLLFTQQEIQKGIPVLREFLDARARQEKEEFEKERENKIETESYDFASCGVDGSGILDRAMEEATKFVNKQGKTLALIAQLESEIESRKKNYDNVAKDYHKKIQVSKENVDKLRQQQEETTNRIESNFIRKQQTQELAKQEQLEGELDQQTTRFLLEKNEFEEEIKRLQKELDDVKVGTSKAMTNEYQEFYNKICKSAQLAVELLVKNKFDFVTNEKEYTENVIVELNKKVKDLEADNVELKTRLGLPVDQPVDGHYDENGNYVYANGSFYDPEGNYHDAEGNVFSPDGQLIESAEDKPKEEKPVNFDEVEFYTDLDTKDDVINMANNIVDNLKNGTQSEGVTPETEESTQSEKKGDDNQFPRSGVVDSVVDTQVQETSAFEEIPEVKEVSEPEVQPEPETETVPVVEEPVNKYVPETQELQSESESMENVPQVQEENKIEETTPPTANPFNFDFDNDNEETETEDNNIQNGFSFDDFDDEDDDDESDDEESDDDDDKSESEEKDDDDIDDDKTDNDDIDDDEDDIDEIDDEFEQENFEPEVQSEPIVQSEPETSQPASQVQPIVEEQPVQNEPEVKEQVSIPNVEVEEEPEEEEQFVQPTVEEELVTSPVQSEPEVQQEMEQEEIAEPETKFESKIDRLFASLGKEPVPQVQPEDEEQLVQNEPEVKEQVSIPNVEIEEEPEVEEESIIAQQPVQNEIQPEIEEEEIIEPQPVVQPIIEEKPVVNVIQETIQVEEEQIAQLEPIVQPEQIVEEVSEPVVQPAPETESEPVVEEEPEVQSSPVLDIEKYADDPDVVVREYVGKIQIARQLVDRFNQKLAKTNNRLEIEYIKMQQERELKKQTQLEEEFVNYLANRGSAPINRIEVREEVTRPQEPIPQQSFVQQQNSYIQKPEPVVQPVQNEPVVQPVQQSPQIRITEVDEEYYDDGENEEVEEVVVRRPGRPKGTTKVEKPVPSGRKPGRPRKIDLEDPSPTDDEISSIEEQIARETSKVNQIRDNYNQEMTTAINSLNKPEKKVEEKNLDKEVSSIKKQASTAKKNKDVDSMDFMNKKLAALINQVKKDQRAQQKKQEEENGENN
ncbi:MAG: hypothetical protein IJ008_04145 [Clostridia bacterium]|nr:hypothetical protein [Clostridia bacterium]